MGMKTVATTAKSMTTCANLKNQKTGSFMIKTACGDRLTKFGVNKGLQAGSSCCVNLESVARRGIRALVNQ
jgi:hypothetical protein